MTVVINACVSFLQGIKIQPLINVANIEKNTATANIDKLYCDSSNPFPNIQIANSFDTRIIPITIGNKIVIIILNNLDINVNEVNVEMKSENRDDFSQNLNQQFNKGNNKQQRRAVKFEIENENESSIENDLLKTDSNINRLI